MSAQVAVAVTVAVAVRHVYSSLLGGVVRGVCHLLEFHELLVHSRVRERLLSSDARLRLHAVDRYDLVGRGVHGVTRGARNTPPVVGAMVGVIQIVVLIMPALLTSIAISVFHQDGVTVHGRTAGARTRSHKDVFVLARRRRQRPTELWSFPQRPSDGCQVRVVQRSIAA